MGELLKDEDFGFGLCPDFNTETNWDPFDPEVRKSERYQLCDTCPLGESTGNKSEALENFCGLMSLTPEDVYEEEHAYMD